MHVGSQLWAGRLHLATGLSEAPISHLELFVELGIYVQADEHGLCEAWGVRGRLQGSQRGRLQTPASTLSLAPRPTGSPARANSTSSLGSVAENSTVCWPPGRRPMISCSCSAKPISKSLQGMVGREGQW